MRTICRLTIPYVEGRDMADVLNEALKATGVTLADIHAATRGQESHFGNWVYTPVTYCAALLKVVSYFRDNFTWPGELIDMRRGVLEAVDLQSLRQGQKVTVKFLNDFCFPVEERGTVFGLSESGLSILKHRSRSKGWKFAVGDEVEITPWKGGAK